VTAKPVEVALRAVPRHAFVPDVPLDVAYADDIVRTKYDAGGATIRSLCSHSPRSSPSKDSSPSLRPAPGLPCRGTDGI
jgi:hypothetical protein